MATTSDKRRRFIPRHVRWFVFARDGEVCAFCGITEKLQMDHIIPWSIGGPNDSWNLRPACGPCNVKRMLSVTADDTTTRAPVAKSCGTCNPHHPTDCWGFCYRCRQYGDIAEDQVDRCPDAAACNCDNRRTYSKRHARRVRKARNKAARA